MASFNPQDFGFGFEEPPPRPDDAAGPAGLPAGPLRALHRRLVVYGVPYVAERVGYAWEAGRARAATEALAKLDKAGDRQPGLRAVPDGDRPPSRRPSSTSSRSGPPRRARACRALPVGGNPMAPGFQGAGARLGRDHRQGERLRRHQQPRHQGRRRDHGPARPGRRRPGPARRRRPQDRPRRAPDQGRRVKVEAEWGDSDKLDIGDWVLAIGSPLGFDHSVTAGIVSATERNDVQDRRVRVVHPDRRGDQPGQLGRPADRPGGQGRRDQHGDHHPDRRLRGDRPGDPVVAGQAGRRGPDQGGEGRPRLPGRRGSSR